MDNYSAEERVFSIPELRLMILSFSLDTRPPPNDARCIYAGCLLRVFARSLTLPRF